MQCYLIQIVNVAPSIERPRSYEELSLNNQAEMEHYIRMSICGVQMNI